MELKSFDVIVVADLYDSPSIPSHQLSWERSEWESFESYLALKTSLQTFVQKVSLVESPREVLSVLQKVLAEGKQNETIVFQLVEGYQSRNRVGYIPSLCEYLGICHIGSDAKAHLMSLDKCLTKSIVSQKEIPTPNFHLVESRYHAEELILTWEEVFLQKQLRFPVFAKPNGEGSSIGISASNVLTRWTDVESYLFEISDSLYPQIIEEYLPGEEYTIGVFGNPGSYTTTAVGQIVLPENSLGVYSAQVKTKDKMPESIQLKTLPKSEEKTIQDQTLQICEALGVEGFARLDWKRNREGKLSFMEINLSPGLSPYYSSLPILFQESGMGNYTDLLKQILLSAIESYQSPRFRYGKERR